MQADLRFWVSIPELAGVSLPVGMPVWDLRDLDRRPVPVIGHSEAGPLIAVRQGDGAAFVLPGANRAICLAEPEMMDGSPLWLDALPWAVAAIVARHGKVCGGRDKANDYAEKMPAARWRPAIFSDGLAELVSGHRRLMLSSDVEMERDAKDPAGWVQVRNAVQPSCVANAPWPYGVPMAAPAFHKASPYWTADMPADASDVAALRLTVAAALREGVLRRDSVAQLAGNGAA